MKACSKCGRISDSKFCPDCGSLMSEVKAVVDNETIEESRRGAALEGATDSNIEGVCENDIKYFDVHETIPDFESVDTFVNSADVDGEEHVICDEEPKQEAESSFAAGPVEKSKVTTKNWFIVLMLFVFFPVGVFFMWKYKKFNKSVRVVTSVLLGLNFAFWALIFVVLLLPCDHEWNVATCTQPKTCSICDETEGDALGHTEGDWEMESADGVDATAEYVKECTVCGTAMDYKTEELTTLTAGESFYMSPSEFVERLGNYLDEISGNNLEVFEGSVDGDFACGIREDGEKVGALLFTDGDGTVSESDANTSGCFGAVLGTVEDGDDGSSLRVLLAIVEVCDPSLDFDEAKDVGEQALMDGSVTKNGITYVYSMQSGGALIGVSVLD